MTRRPITLPRISIQSFDPDNEPGCLFGPDATARETKNGAAAEAGRREVDTMQAVAQRQAARQQQINTKQADLNLSRSSSQVGGNSFAELLNQRISKASRLPHGELSCETMEITPEFAEHILANHNSHNRGLRKAHADRFAKIIRGGMWMVTSQGISFARSGRLNDGQHRLTGIIRAGQPVSIRVTFGEADDAFQVLDTNAVRGGSDTLHVAGYKNTNVLAAAARLLYIIESGNPLSNVTASNKMVLAMLSKHPDLETATVPGGRIAKKFRCSTAGTTAAFYLIDKHSARAHRLPEFIDRLGDGVGQSARSPIISLRDGLMQKSIDSHFRSAGNRGVAQAASIIKAWNLWASNRKGTALQWQADETFPLPV